MKRWASVAVIGVGLIGGSIGLALRRRNAAEEVVGIGWREDSLRKALKRSAVTRVTTDIADGVRQSELIVICTPVAQIVPHIRQAAGCCPGGALITDVGSTKQGIVQAMEPMDRSDVTFIGSHPLAGSEKTGVQHAREDLFKGRMVVVTPTGTTPQPQLAAVTEFWSELGASVTQMSPADHDHAVASTSHVPHLLAAALAAATPERYLPLVAGGWLDTTRVAAGGVELWQQILRENRIPILNAVDEFSAWLDRFRNAIREDNAQQIKELLDAGKRHRDAVGSGHPSRARPT